MSEEQAEKVSELLDVWEDAYQSYGRDVSAETLCRQHHCPELVNELAMRQRLLRRTRWLNRTNERGAERSERSRHNRRA